MNPPNLLDLECESIPTGREIFVRTIESNTVVLDWEKKSGGGKDIAKKRAVDKKSGGGTDALKKRKA